MPDIKYGIHFGDAKADKDSKTELLSTLKDLVYAKTTPPLRGRFKGSGGNAESPGAFRHFGAQNGTTFVPHKSPCKYRI